MKQDKDFEPAEALRYLKESNLPLIAAFTFEEERGKSITGKCLCYIENLYGTSRVKLGKFSPHRSLFAIQGAGSFYATFDIEGKTFGCIMENITVESSFLISDIPRIISPFHRKFLRVEPSRKSPVVLYISTEGQGTVSHSIKDISERGIGFVTDSVPGIPNKLVCGIHIPLDGGIFILSPAVVVYNREISERVASGGRRAEQGLLSGLQLFPHNDDEKKIRLYVMQRELEIRRKIQDML